MNEAIPEGKWTRMGIAGSAAVKVGLRQLQHKVKRPFLSVENRQVQQEEVEDENAKQLFQALTQLRGTALKAAQMLSMEMEILSERYRKELEKSFHQVPPLNRVLVRKAFLDTLNTTPEMLFAEFEAQAFAAASLGQVHKAQLNDGTSVAVKIQYPGVRAAMSNDLEIMRTVAKGLPNSKIALQSLDEIQARLMEEVNYHLEANTTQWFAEHLKVEGVSVPKVFPQWSSERILTTELMGGLHLEAWLATHPSQQARDKAAQCLYDTMVYSARTLRRLHADPNPGNYLFHEDGSVSLIDFGCVKSLSQAFSEVLPQLLHAFDSQNKDEILAAYQVLGMEHSPKLTTWYEEVLKPFAEWAARPMHEAAFDFKVNANYTNDARDILQRLAKTSGLNHVADEFIFFDRTVYGLCKIFERMGATVRMRHHWFE